MHGVSLPDDETGVSLPDDIVLVCIGHYLTLPDTTEISSLSSYVLAHMDTGVDDTIHWVEPKFQRAATLRCISSQWNRCVPRSNLWTGLRAFARSMSLDIEVAEELEVYTRSPAWCYYRVMLYYGNIRYSYVLKYKHETKVPTMSTRVYQCAWLLWNDGDDEITVRPHDIAPCVGFVARGKPELARVPVAPIGTRWVMRRLRRPRRVYCPSNLKLGSTEQDIIHRHWLRMHRLSPPFNIFTHAHAPWDQWKRQVVARLCQIEQELDRPGSVRTHKRRRIQ
jgi:hypothetical protein